MVLENNLSLVKKVNRLLDWGHWFTLFNILIALTATSVYWLSEPVPQSFLGVLYLVLNWLGHTAFLCFMFFILTIFPLSLVFPYQRHVRGLAAILASLGLVTLIFDAYVYASLGYHIGSTSFDQTLDLLRQQIVTNLRNFVLIVSVVTGLLLALELIISNFCWKKSERLRQAGIAKPALITFIGSFMLSHLLHVYADANLKWDVTKQDNVLPFSYPATAKTFLARYQLVDTAQFAQMQQDKFSYLQPVTTEKILTCQESDAGPSTVLIITDTLPTSLQEWLKQQGLRPLEQHYAPVTAQESLLNLLYSQFLYNEQQLQLLHQPPGWLSQLPDGHISITSTTEQPLLPWLHNTPTARYAIVFEQQLQQNWHLYQPYQRIAIVSLAASHPQFQLAPTTAFTNWTELQQQSQHQVSQQLDWLPTLLTQAGCHSKNRWLGDNLQHPSALPKLHISQQQYVSFKKDKMVILRSDGSYGVWSAGTLLPLNEKLDLPMLTDALKRIEHFSASTEQ